MAARSSRIDALRGFAVFGILVVNVWAFANGLAMYHTSLADGLSLADQWSVLLVAGLAEQKFYPIFAFLFGAGFALQTGSRRECGAARDAYLRRLRWLLAVGLVHGTLIWFGDILTAYAVTGFWLAPKAGRPLRELRTSLYLLVAVNVLVLLVLLMLGLDVFDLDFVIGQAYEAQRAHAIYSTGSWSDVASLRLHDFGVNVVSYLIFLPRLALLFVLGVFAVRLGWLTRPARHRAGWRKVLVAGLAVGVPLNACWSLAALWDTAFPFLPMQVGPLADLGGPCLGAAYVAAFMLTRERLIAWLAPVGKMALTNYLTQSLVLSFLLQGFGLGLGDHLTRAQLLALCGAMMACQYLFCHWWLSSHAQGPFEAAWRRYTAGAAVKTAARG
ncbi:MAG: DUF418 domain-containing protein [Pseudomonadota bacterium]